MKNRAVELLIRTQHNIPDDIDVKVECQLSVDSRYFFSVGWWIDDTFNNIDLEVQSSDVSTTTLCGSS